MEEISAIGERAAHAIMPRDLDCPTQLFQLEKGPSRMENVIIFAFYYNDRSIGLQILIYSQSPTLKTPDSPNTFIHASEKALYSNSGW
jgi:hypothetical protein